MKVDQNLCKVVLLQAVLALLLLCVPKAALSDQDQFPHYDCLKPNVEFWKAIYSRYSTSQGVIHDSEKLGRVYEVVDLEDTWDQPARQRNKKIVESVKQKYANILLKLAQYPRAETEDEKRVLALFGDGVQPCHLEKAAENIRLQIGQKNMFREGVIRSGAYLDEIREIIKSYGLPEDLAYLPHVESSFNYNAYSKIGAAGIWQFTQSTGKEFLTINYTLDERRDPIRATHAAAKLLKENYRRLGSWPLAITAYNHGTNGMLRAKESKGDYETIFSEYESPLFKFASRNFYSEFLAAREVARNYSKYFGSLSVSSPVQCKEMKLCGYMRVDELVQHLGLELETFRHLNPGLRDPVYSGQKYIPKDYHVRLPARTNVAKLATEIPASLYKGDQKSSSFYVVRRGDTASAIARAHSIRLQDLLAANQLSPKATVYAGQNLRIPKADEKVVIVAAAAKKQVGQGKAASLKSAKAAHEEKAEEAGGTVPVAGKEEKDGGAQPAKTEAVAVASVKAEASPKVESLPENPAKQKTAAAETAGQKKAAGPPAPEAPAPIVTAAAATGKVAVENINPAVVTGNLQVEQVIRKKGKAIGIIRVEAEETLSHYAEWLGVKAEELRKLNRLRAGKNLNLHQQIKIPLGKIGKEKFEEIRYEYHKEMEEDFFAAYRVETVRHYKIKDGDNIWKLCQNEFELPFWLIKKYNAEINWDGLKPDQSLVIPVVAQLS